MQYLIIALEVHLNKPTINARMWIIVGKHVKTINYQEKLNTNLAISKAIKVAPLPILKDLSAPEVFEKLLMVKMKMSILI